MHSELSWLEAIAPDLMGIITKRYQVLQYVSWMAPVGRRTLADQMKISERALRTETDFLRGQGLLESSQSGMILTRKGLETFHGLDQMMNQLLGVKADEKRLAQKLGIDHCLIISGDSDQSDRVLDEIGKTLNTTMQLLLPPGNLTVAVMGGTTMAHVASQMSYQLSAGRELTFVPARGGLGEAVDIQANSVAAAMAHATDSEFRVLYVPEHVSQASYAPLLKEPSVRDVLTQIDNAQVVIHSIGDAIVMAKRRNMSPEIISMLTQKHAVAEAFGVFIAADGEVIYKIPRIGLQIADLTHIPYVFAVAGGKSKAKAIAAYAHHAPRRTWLITDVGAANSILTGATR